MIDIIYSKIDTFPFIQEKKNKQKSNKFFPNNVRRICTLHELDMYFERILQFNKIFHATYDIANIH